MAFIVWNSTFSVGVREMDNQHQTMIEIINQLYDSLRAEKGDQELGVIIKKMVDYTRYHFSSEERLLFSKGYAEFYRQKKNTTPSF